MRLIDADALVLRMTTTGWLKQDGLKDSAEMIAVQATIDDAPSIDAAPVVHGRWVHSRTQSEFAISKCSVCGKEQFAISHVVTEGNYCPNCGARMK